MSAITNSVRGLVDAVRQLAGAGTPRTGGRGAVSDADFGRLEGLIELEFQRHLTEAAAQGAPAISRDCVDGHAEFAEYVSAYAEYLDRASVHVDLPGLSLLPALG